MSAAQLIFDSDGNMVGDVRGGAGLPGATDAPEWYTGQPVFLLDGEVVAYTEAQAAARADRPRHPARWSNTSMRWEDTRTLADVRGLKLMRLQAARKEAEAAGFEVAGRRFQSDADSIMRIQVAAMAAQAAGSGWSTEWTLADNTTATLTRAQMLAVCAGLFAHLKAQRDRAKLLREQIDAAGSADEIEAVQWLTEP